MDWKRSGSLFLVSIPVSVSLIALFFIGDAVLKTPLIPFDFFAWLTRVLPGQVITFGIDQLVASLTFFGMDIAEASKPAEQVMAVVLTLIILVIGLLVSWLLMKNWRQRWPAMKWLPGLLIGAFFLAIHLTLPYSPSENRFAASAWILIVTSLWSAAGFRLLDQADVFHVKKEEEGDGYSVKQTDRRKFLIRISETSAAITVLGVGLQLLLRDRESVGVAEGGLPSGFYPQDFSEDSVVPGTRPEVTPVEDHYLIDINPRPPLIQEEGYQLRIHGLVDQELMLSLDAIREDFSAVEHYITLSCISNPIAGPLIGTTKWTGANLLQVLSRAGIREEGRFLEIRSVDGFHESLSLEEAYADTRIMLVYAWDDLPLTIEHGFPLRIWIPNRYGMKQPRWITEIEIIERERDGYWVERGWDREAVVKTTSVIDTIGRPITSEYGSTIVPIGGIAYSGDRGISSVRVRIDDSAWQEALLFPPLSENTWVIWRYDWPYSPGDHVFEVSTIEGDGTEQISSSAPPHPSGASGIHQVEKDL